MASPVRTLVLSGAVAAIVATVAFVQMTTWDAISTSGTQHALQDAGAAQAIGRLEGAVSALKDVADAPDEIRDAAHTRVIDALELVDEALDTTDVQSLEAQNALSTARTEADAVAEVVAAARATSDPDQRLRHLIGAGVHVFELRSAQGSVAHARRSATNRLRTQGRLTTFALFGAVLLCAPLAFTGFGASPSRSGPSSSASSEDANPPAS